MLHFPRFTPADLKLLETRHGYRASDKTTDLYEVIGYDGLTRATFFKNKHGYGVRDSQGIVLVQGKSLLLSVFRGPLNIPARQRQTS